MLIMMIFVLGILNFAVHKAVIESRHPMIDALPDLMRRNGGRVSLVCEFTVLLAAMLMVGNGWTVIAWFYGAYSLFNGVAGWIILSRRI